MVDCLKDEKETKQGNKRVVLYTIHCPKCKILEKKLRAANIDFVVNENLEEMFSKGFETAPMLEVGDNQLDFGQAVQWLKQCKGEM